MHSRAADSILIASFPMARTALRTKWTSISVAYLNGLAVHLGDVDRSAYSRNSARTIDMFSLVVNMNINSSLVTLT